MGSPKKCFSKSSVYGIHYICRNITINISYTAQQVQYISRVALVFIVCLWLHAKWILNQCESIEIPSCFTSFFVWIGVEHFIKRTYTALLGVHLPFHTDTYLLQPQNRATKKSWNRLKLNTKWFLTTSEKLKWSFLIEQKKKLRKFRWKSIDHHKVNHTNMPFPLWRCEIS